MEIAQVVGTVVSTVKVGEFRGCKLLMVAPVDKYGMQEAEDASYVAVDAIGAGAGELVLVARGSAARYTSLSRDMACDATIVAIIDSLDASGETTYVKS